MRLLYEIAIAAALAAVSAGCGDSGPVMSDLDNICTVEFADGSREDIICSWAAVSKPAFRKVADGQILISFHDGSLRRIRMDRVVAWSFSTGDTDHFGRYVKVNGHWTKADQKGGAE